MIRAEKEISASPFYPLSRLGKEEDILFFDIETTGFSAGFNMCYLIGCLFAEKDHFRLVQWLAEDLEEEETMLREFALFTAPFGKLVSFNGDTFDLPFLKKRAALYGMLPLSGNPESIDIYKLLKPCKALLGLPDLKQKSVELFLGIEREDRYSGGELIEVYFRYRAQKAPSDLRLLMLHNEEDVTGMLQVLSALAFRDFFTGSFSQPEVTAGENEVHFTCRSETSLPRPVNSRKAPFSLRAEGNTLILSADLRKGELRRYYEDYKNYYYLPLEDTAVHKSVGDYVDRAARQKATRATCYTRVSGSFLPQLSPLLEPVLAEDLDSPVLYVPFDASFPPSPEKSLQYCREILSFFLSGKYGKNSKKRN